MEDTFLAGTLVRQKNRGRGFKPSNKKKKKKGSKGSTQANTQSIVNKVYMYPMRGARQNPKSLGKSNVNIIRQQIPIPIPGIPQGATPNSRHQKAVAHQQYLKDQQDQNMRIDRIGTHIAKAITDKRMTEEEKLLRAQQTALASQQTQTPSFQGSSRTEYGTNTQAPTPVAVKREQEQEEEKEDNEDKADYEPSPEYSELALEQLQTIDELNEQAFKDAETNPITPRHRMPDGTQYTELQQKMFDSASFKTDEEDAHQTDDDDSIRLRRVNEVRARGRNNNKQDASTVRIPPVEEQSDPTLISRFKRSARNFVSGKKDSSISKSDKPRLSATMVGSRNRRKVHRSLGEISEI
jgi:hypothetical protein